MEETMRVLTITELMRMAKIELWRSRGADHKHPAGIFRKDRPKSEAAHINLRRIRRILARRDFSP